MTDDTPDWGEAVTMLLIVVALAIGVFSGYQSRINEEREVYHQVLVEKEQRR